MWIWIETAAKKPGLASAQMLPDDMIPFHIRAGIEIAEVLQELVEVDGLTRPFRRENGGRPNQDKQQHRDISHGCPKLDVMTFTHSTR